MSKEGPIAEPLQIGEMPKPRYLKKMPDTTGDGEIKWIGMEAYGFDGQIKEFLFWRNFGADGDLSDELARHDAAAFIARVHLERGAEAAIGFPINIGDSNPQSGEVKIVEETGVFGVYIESRLRPMFNFFTAMNGIKGEAELREVQPDSFRETYNKAKAVLPYPPKQ